MPTSTTWGALSDAHKGRRLVLRFPWAPDEDAPFVFASTLGPGQRRATAWDEETGEPIATTETIVHNLTWPDGTTGEVSMPPDLPVTLTD